MTAVAGCTKPLDVSPLILLSYVYFFVVLLICCVTESLENKNDM